jgi:hypothetical protein
VISFPGLAREFLVKPVLPADLLGDDPLQFGFQFTPANGAKRLLRDCVL